MPDANQLAVIWDVDGTLVDTAELHFQAWLALTREIGKPFTRADFAATFGLRNADIIPQLFGTHYTQAEVAELSERKEVLYRTAARQHGVRLLPGARKLCSKACGPRDSNRRSVPVLRERTSISFCH